METLISYWAWVYAYRAEHAGTLITAWALVCVIALIAMELYPYIATWVSIRRMRGERKRKLVQLNTEVQALEGVLNDGSGPVPGKAITAMFCARRRLRDAVAEGARGDEQWFRQSIAVLDGALVECARARQAMEEGLTQVPFGLPKYLTEQEPEVLGKSGN